MPLKILMATMQLDIGGAETHIVELAKELKRRGVDVTVVSGGGVYVGELEKCGVRHITAPLYSKDPRRVFSSLRILDRLLSGETFDILHAHARIPAVVCGYLAKKHHVRFVTTAHLTFAVNALWRKISRWGEKSIAVSCDIKEYLIREYGMCSDNITVTVNGIDTETFSPACDSSAVAEEFSLSPDRRHIVSVSRIDSDRSAPAFALCALAPEIHKRFPDIDVILVGGGNDFERLKKEAERINSACGERLVILTGPRTDISRLIGTATVFVNVSRAALEAMSMEKPVILAGNEGYAGILTPEVLPSVIPTNFCCRGLPLLDRKTIFRDLCTLLSMTGEERAALGRFGRETVLQMYSVARMTDDYLAMYESVRPYRDYRYGEILICGYYGFGNMGDDSLLRAILGSLRDENPDVTVTVMAEHPGKVTQDYGVHTVSRYDLPAVWCAMKHAKLLIFGGGSLLQDGSSRRSLLYYTTVLRLAKRAGLKIMVYANGIGPLSAEKSKQDAGRALCCADLITLREENSLALCRTLGVPEEKCLLTADPAFALQEPQAEWVQHLRGKLGLSADVRFFVVALREWKEDGERHRADIAAACDRIRETCGLVPVFLPMHEALDSAVCRETAALCHGETKILSGVTGAELLSLLRGAEFVLAMRLHTLIYSTAVAVPSVALAYDGKLSAFMNHMELPYYVEDTDTERILSCVRDLTEHREEICRKLQEKRKAEEALAQENAHLALSLLSGEALS